MACELILKSRLLRCPCKRFSPPQEIIHAQRLCRAAVAARSADVAKANRELEEAAITDPLTKAYNRRYFQLSVEVDAQRALRSYFDPRADARREDVVFFLVDVDHFKQANDNFGHSGGDRVLQGVAERLKRTIRASDTLIRWGGEEFLVVTRGSRREDAVELGKRILDAVGGQPFKTEPGHTLRCTCSVVGPRFLGIDHNPIPMA